MAVAVPGPARDAWQGLAGPQELAGPRKRVRTRCDTNDAFRSARSGTVLRARAGDGSDGRIPGTEEAATLSRRV